MSRIVCFFSDEDGQTGICLNSEQRIDCKKCNMNPFPGKIVPDDRVLRSSNMTADFEYEPLTDDEQYEMMKGRVHMYTHRTRGRYQALKALHNTSAYAFEYELITAADWAAMTVGEHRFPRHRNIPGMQRGRGFTRLRFSLRNQRRR